MTYKLSAGLLMFRRKNSLEVLLVHPGGPFWARKDDGVWSIPKGEYEPGDDPLEAAQREFEEETGFRPNGRYIALTPLEQQSGKVVSAWAIEGDCDASAILSNTFKMEWPPKSGRFPEFPEVDRAEWFDVNTARSKMISGQVGFLEEIRRLVSGGE
jgi:predicted NUDIX family NTP pyrophosphohydrolase